MTALFETLLVDEEIQMLLLDSEKRVLESQVYENEEALFDSQKVIRLVFLLINHCFASDDVDIGKLKKTYLLLRSLTITNPVQLNQFNEICGIDGVDDELLYFFYLSAISIQHDKIINIRIDLLEYSEVSLKKESDNWKIRILNKILNSFIFLSRKKNGFINPGTPYLFIINPGTPYLFIDKN